MRKLSVLLALGMALSACVPIPRREYFAPTVSGTVVSAGVLVQNAELHLSSPFTHKMAVVSTDSNGRFNVGPLRVWRLSTFLLGSDRLYKYSLLIRIASTEYPGVSAAGMGYAPPGLKILCDLSKPLPSGQTQVYCARVGNDAVP
jgi:hypothetical protein